MARQPRSLTEFRNLVQLCLSRAIMFNSRRAGEASRMLVSEYEARTREDVREDFALSELEKKMLQR